MIRYDTIFKHKRMRKSEFYSFYKALLESYGWENISSNLATDYDVFFSKGEDGKQNLYVNMRENFDGTSNTHFSTSTYSYIDVRAMEKYTPNVDMGKAGIFSHPATNWTRVRMSDTAYPRTFADVYYTGNKDRVIVFYRNEQTGYTNMLYIGKPRAHYSKSTPFSGNTIIPTNSYRAGITTVNEPDTTTSGSYDITAITKLSPRSYNASNEIDLSEIVLFSSFGGFKAYVDGIFSATSDYLLQIGNIESYRVKRGNRVYRLLYMMPSGGGYSKNITTDFIAIAVEDDQ